MNKEFEYEIEYVNRGVANKFGDRIEIHKDLISYPDLYWPILNHELGHLKGFSMKDFMHDFKPVPELNYWKLSLFMLRRPRTWIQLSPIWITKKGIIIDWNHLIINSIMLIAFLSIAFFLLFSF